jgi:hypothetical protein
VGRRAPAPWKAGHHLNMIRNPAVSNTRGRLIRIAPTMLP